MLTYWQANFGVFEDLTFLQLAQFRLWIRFLRDIIA
jgi:hypothetical protein